jgi:TolA-binding protein
MADSAKVRRRATALALIPATAGVFGASVAWASSHDPFAAGAGAAPAAVASANPATTPDPQPTVDQQVSDLAAKITQAQDRIAQLQVTLDAQTGGTAAQPGKSAAAKTAPKSAAPASAGAPASGAAPAAAPAPAAAAPKPAPAVHVVTKPSGV